MASAGTVEKAVELLFHLHTTPAPQGVTAIGRALDVPKSSIHRLLSSLRRRDLVERDDRGRYRPGVGLVALGLGVLRQEPVVAAARRILETAAAEVGETFFLVAARAQRLVVLDKVEGSGFLRASPHVGADVPVHATAVGKLYMAHEPEAFPLPEGPLESFTAATHDAGALEAEVCAVRAGAWAANRGEWVAGLSVLAAPVVLDGRLVAAVALAVASARLPELGGEEQAAERVVEAARAIERRLDGRLLETAKAGATQ